MKLGFSYRAPTQSHFTDFLFRWQFTSLYWHGDRSRPMLQLIQGKKNLKSDFNRKFLQVDAGRQVKTIAMVKPVNDRIRKNSQNCMCIMNILRPNRALVISKDSFVL